MEDLIIIGGGPAGLSAAVYAALLDMKFFLLEAETLGGLTIQAHQVENFIGFQGKSGQEIIDTFVKHLEHLKVDIKCPLPATGVELAEKNNIVKTMMGDFTAKTLIITTGTRFLGLAQETGIEGEKEFAGKGVSYCPECDGPFFKDMKVLISGSVYDAFFLKGLAKKVIYLGPISEKEARQMTPEIIEANDIIYMEGQLQRIYGENVVKGVVIDDKELEVDGVFLTAREAGSELFQNMGLEIDDDGYLVVNRRMETNIPSVFAAGDITGEPWQIAKSIGEGAVAALSAYRYLTGESVIDLGWSIEF